MVFEGVSPFGADHPGTHGWPGTALNLQSWRLKSGGHVLNDAVHKGSGTRRKYTHLKDPSFRGLLLEFK